MTDAPSPWMLPIPYTHQPRYLSSARAASTRGTTEAPSKQRYSATPGNRPALRALSTQESPCPMQNRTVPSGRRGKKSSTNCWVRSMRSGRPLNSTTTPFSVAPLLSIRSQIVHEDEGSFAANPLTNTRSLSFASTICAAPGSGLASRAPRSATSREIPSTRATPMASATFAGNIS